MEHTTRPFGLRARSRLIVPGQVSSGAKLSGSSFALRSRVRSTIFFAVLVRRSTHVIIFVSAEARNRVCVCGERWNDFTTLCAAKSLTRRTNTPKPARPRRLRERNGTWWWSLTREHTGSEPGCVPGNRPLRWPHGRNCCVEVFSTFLFRTKVMLFFFLGAS